MTKTLTQFKEGNAAELLRMIEKKQKEQEKGKK
jgi:hypothetical protein